MACAKMALRGIWGGFDQHSLSEYLQFLVKTLPSQIACFFPGEFTQYSTRPHGISRFKCGSFIEIYLHSSRPAGTSFILGGSKIVSQGF